jgi:hypothetical protein
MIPLDRLQQHLDEWRSGVGVPFVAAAVRADGRLLWSGVSGSIACGVAATLAPRSKFPAHERPS